MLIKKVCILGGTGFVGRSLANRLSSAGYEVRILTRDRESNKNNLILLPKLHLVEADVHDPESLIRNLSGCDAVINLVGILNETGTKGKEFNHVHVELTRKVIMACRQLGIKRLLQMSALNADENGPSHYLRTKGEAENLAHEANGVHVTSFRPSVIFGPGDSFFNRFAQLLKMTPIVFPLACAKARFAPVYISDLTEAIIRTLNEPAWYGKRLEFAGPKVYTLQELVQYTADCIGIKRLIFPLPDFLSRIQAVLFDVTGIFFKLVKIQKPFSMDNYLSSQPDSTTENNALDQMGIPKTAIEAVVPQYLANKTCKSRYSNYRQSSGRNG